MAGPFDHVEDRSGSLRGRRRLDDRHADPVLGPLLRGDVVRPGEDVEVDEDR